MLAAKRVGWKFDGPFDLIDDLGRKVSIVEKGVALVAKELQDAAQRGNERRVAQRSKDPAVSGSRVSFTQLKRALSQKGKRFWLRIELALRMWRPPPHGPVSSLQSEGTT